MFLRPLRSDQHPPLLNLCLPSSFHTFLWDSHQPFFLPPDLWVHLPFFLFSAQLLNPSTFHPAPPSASALSHKDSVPQYICVTISFYYPVFLYLTHPACLLSGVKMCNPVLGVGVGGKRRARRCRDQNSLRPLSNQMTGTSLIISLGGQIPPSQEYCLFCVHPRCNTQSWWPSTIPGRIVTKIHSQDPKPHEEQASLADPGFPL